MQLSFYLQKIRLRLSRIQQIEPNQLSAISEDFELASPMSSYAFIACGASKANKADETIQHVFIKLW